MSVRHAWQLHDPETLEDYFLPSNPLSDESYGINKSVTYSIPVSTYVDGDSEERARDVVIFLKPDEQQTFNYSGTLFRQEEYEAFMEWFSKDYPIELTDDLGRTSLIYVETFKADRVRSIKFPWRHAFTITGIILEEL